MGSFNIKIINQNNINAEQVYQIQKLSKIGYWEVNLITGEIMISDVVFDLFDIDENIELTLENFKKCVYPDDLPILENALLKSEITGTYEATHRIIKKDGGLIYVHELAKRFEENNNVYLKGIIQDITEYKKANDEIENLLKEKEILIKEIHHRIKNSLQQIQSLLGIQLENTSLKFNLLKEKNECQINCYNEIQKILLDAKQRIFAISIIHDLFYKQSTDFNDFISILFKNIKISYSQENKNIELEIIGDSFNLSLEQIIPCGLIVNEIVTNSFKHAFKERENGKIMIELKVMDSKYQMTISDDGIGIEENKIKFSKGIGLPLIYGLTEQLGGTVELKTDKSGTTYIIIFNKNF